MTVTNFPLDYILASCLLVTETNSYSQSFSSAHICPVKDFISVSLYHMWRTQSLQWNMSRSDMYNLHIIPLKENCLLSTASPVPNSKAWDGSAAHWPTMQFGPTPIWMAEIKVGESQIPSWPCEAELSIFKLSCSVVKINFYFVFSFCIWDRFLT